jgi:hypothetical protein
MINQIKAFLSDIIVGLSVAACGAGLTGVLPVVTQRYTMVSVASVTSVPPLQNSRRCK